MAELTVRLAGWVFAAVLGREDAEADELEPGGSDLATGIVADAGRPDVFLGFTAPAVEPVTWE